MRFEPAAAKDALGSIPVSRTTYVDFTHDTAANPASPLLRGNPTNLHYFAHKFVSRRATKIMIAAKNLDIGVADSGKAYTNKRPPRPQVRQGLFFCYELLFVYNEGEH